MKTTKAKGFTLIELIVVIAIIGVLAAILVPTMLGYVTKSRCSSANANAKSFYNAINSALVDLDSEGVDTTAFNGAQGDQATLTAFDSSHSDLETKVENYFADYQKLSGFGYNIADGACTAVVIKSGAYYGSYPNPTTVDDPGTSPTGVSTQCKTAPTLVQAGA